jgi:hypothetical protein
MGGGTLEVDGRLSWGDYGGGGVGGGGGELNVSGGAEITCNELAYEGGGARDWTLNLDGGTITVIGEFSAPRRDPNLAPGDANAFMNLNSGTLECGSFSHVGKYAMDIDEGVFIIHGDVQEDMEDDVAAGYITAFDGTTGVIVEVADGNTIVRADYVLVKASDPSPADYAINVCPGEQLSWKEGGYAVDHNVYFGTDWNDVNDMTEPCAILALGNEEWDPGVLELGQTYYWRVDEVNDACDDSPWVGDIWEFTMNDGSARVPSPIDLAVKVDPNNVELQWTSGCTAQSHDVYFGTSFGEVDDANSTSHPNVEYDNVPDPNYSLGTLDYLTYYYWRIDEVDDGNTYKGRVWQFKTSPYIPDPNMVVWYKFDETAGGTAYDSSGHEIRGEIRGLRDNTWDPNDGKYPGCIRFHNDERVDLYDDVFDYIGESISICVWWKGAYREGNDNNRFCGFGDDDFEMLVRADSEEEDDHGVRWQAGNDANDRLEWTTDGLGWKDDWHHLVFTKNGPEGTMKIYFDTVLVAFTDDANGTTLGKAVANHEEGFRIGTDRDGDSDFVGKADNFRVYDYEISESKIYELFRGGDLGSAWAPQPVDGASDVPWDANVTWKPGDYIQDANGHEVFFGTDWDDVNDMTEPCSAQDACEYDPGILSLGQTYYWRVDEVNDNDPCVWKGKIWSFTVAEYVILDDFEQYDLSDNKITYTWYDSTSQPSGQKSGSVVSLSKLSADDPAHGGEQAMKYKYDTDDFYFWQDLAYADACLPLDEIAGFTDWTTVDVRVLTIFFYGQPDNDANDTEQMYLGVHDSSGDYAEMRYGEHAGEDMNDLKVEEWQRWDVPFIWFTDSNAAVSADIDFSSISSVYLGFGDRLNPVAAGKGTAFFDDLRLSTPFCKPEYGPTGDLSGDCFVGVADIGAMGDEWLRHDINVNPVTEPPTSDPHLVGHWEFDEGAASTAADSSTYNNNGTLETLDVNVSWVVGHSGSALEFDGGRVRVPDAPELRPMNQVSVLAWIKYSDEQDDARVVVKGADNKETFEFEVDDDDDLMFRIRDGNAYDPCEDEYEGYSAGSDDDAIERDEWTHVAGTFDGNTVRCYINGELAAENDDPNISAIPFLCQDTNDLAIGMPPDDDDDNYFEGTIDDVRVYDRAVPRGEIGYIACGSDGICPLESEANFYSGEEPEVIDFKDYATLFDYWGDEELWPPEP